MASHEIDGVRKEKERLTAAWTSHTFGLTAHPTFTITCWFQRLMLGMVVDSEGSGCESETKRFPAGFLFSFPSSRIEKIVTRLERDLTDNSLLVPTSRD